MYMVVPVARLCMICVCGVGGGGEVVVRAREVGEVLDSYSMIYSVC